MTKNDFGQLSQLGKIEKPLGYKVLNTRKVYCFKKISSSGHDRLEEEVQHSFAENDGWES